MARIEYDLEEGQTLAQKEQWCWEPEPLKYFPLKPQGQSFDCSSQQPRWGINDILLASNLLERDEDMTKNKVQFFDEPEMRRVFGLVYDVLRCQYK